MISTLHRRVLLSAAFCASLTQLIYLTSAEFREWLRRLCRRAHDLESSEFRLFFFEHVRFHELQALKLEVDRIVLREAFGVAQDTLDAI